MHSRLLIQAHNIQQAHKGKLWQEKRTGVSSQLAHITPKFVNILYIDRNLPNSFHKNGLSACTCKHGFSALPRKLLH